METGELATSHITIPLPITPGFLWVIFLLAAVGFGFVSWMFVHHWNYYGISGNNRVFVKGVFFVTSITLFVLMVLFISAYAIVS